VFIVIAVGVGRGCFAGEGTLSDVDDLVTPLAPEEE
jgi:hypothetical protein